MSSEPRERGVPWAALAAALAVCQAGLLLSTAWDKSDTADEPYYLSSALSQWTQGNFDETCDAPALPRWGFAAALRLADPPLFDASARLGRDPLWSRPLPQTRINLLAARAATIGVTVAGGLLVWLAARRFGAFAGFVAHALWCFSPSVLASGALATLDAWAASASALVMLAAVRHLERPGTVRAASLGGALGLAAACKVTTLGLAPVALGLAAWAASRPRRGRWGRMAVHGGVLVGGLVLALWAVYGFSLGIVDTGRPCGRSLAEAGYRLGPLPFAPWLEGALLQWRHGSQGHLSYLFGRTGSDGWWWFYLAALALKTTLGAQLLYLLLGLGVVGLAWRRELALDVAILGYPALLLAAMSLGRAQNGIRYLLPAFPLTFLWAARASELATRRFGSRARLAILIALGLGTFESLAVHPHHLMFFNLWAGGPIGGPRYLIDSDDWGQDQRRLAAWQAENRPWRLYYTYYNGRPAHWGIHFEPPPCEPAPGFYALQAVEVHRPKRIAAGCLDWLTVEPPDARLGYSIYLYQVSRPRLERLRAEADTPTPFWRSRGQVRGHDEP